MKTWTDFFFSISFFTSKIKYASYWPVIVLALLLMSGCPGNGGSEGEDLAGEDLGDKKQPIIVNQLTTTIPIPTTTPALTLMAENFNTASVYFELPDDFQWGQLAEVSIDPAATLSNLTLVRTDGGTSSAPTVDFSIKVAAGNDDDACVSGTQALRAEITGNSDFSSTSVSADEATMPQKAIDIIKTGAFTLCTSATSSVDANLTLTGIDISFGFAENCDDPQDIAGRWTGDFTCNNVYEGETNTDSGQVEITITQSGGTAIYWDGKGAVYVGSVCGTSFRHLGIGKGFTESGTFTRTGPTTATKSSTWVSTDTPQFGGTCYDTLTLSPN